MLPVEISKLGAIQARPTAGLALAGAMLQQCQWSTSEKSFPPHSCAYDLTRTVNIKRFHTHCLKKNKIYVFHLGSPIISVEEFHCSQYLSGEHPPVPSYQWKSATNTSQGEHSPVPSYQWKSSTNTSQGEHSRVPSYQWKRATNTSQGEHSPVPSYQWKRATNTTQGEHSPVPSYQWKSEEL